MSPKLPLVIALFSCLALPVMADTSSYIEGHDFSQVPKPTAPDDRKKISVEEFFWYGCPHCYRLDPQLEAWEKRQPADVKLVRIPNNLGREAGMVHERAFYIAQTLGIEGRIHQPLMQALIEYREPLETLPDIRSFFISTAGITGAQFDGVAQSFAVDGAVHRADELASDYRILGTPGIVVGGRYFTDIGQPAVAELKLTEDAAYERMLKVVDFLVDKVRGERRVSH